MDGKVVGKIDGLDALKALTEVRLHPQRVLDWVDYKADTAAGVNDIRCRVFGKIWMSNSRLFYTAWTAFPGWNFPVLVLAETAVKFLEQNKPKY